MGVQNFEVGALRRTLMVQDESKSSAGPASLSRGESGGMGHFSQMHF